MEDRAVIVMGAGNATGGAIARRFAREGYTACISRRNVEKLQPLVQRIEEAGGRVRAFGADARKEDQVQDMFRTVEEEVGPIEVCVFNVGGNVRFSLEETTSRVFYKVWEMGCFAGFLTGREAVRYMKPRGRGTILFTGATSSMRGASGFAAFSGAKFGLRSLAQSLAREFGPQGIHVAHIIIDGAIDTEWIQELFPQTYAKKEEEGILNPEEIAEAYWQLHLQKRSAWTQEMDLRPWMEHF
ncbi:MAG TPA: SDR family oxidoreductase [SAR324 cluster bacterium]|jgi:NAD(P)-dependent dehydrogenase (short-subunit alcohol dehydrogenase family)|nr:SDR family oxidoreductase [SAR324 cluster bacterium]MEE1575562.1 SDR family oxidoreductase [Deltaproteobacteria bacterium]MDP6245915.1 SDR family oxidoreductase [SAR324 cluster bacterium]MDP6465165.1 SDR family oxidoreductase [SAR324 cluster bacterium]MDP7332824.1 SDR family oxidoreductase [SAR324 cluster bacterium]|tara:strand:- start:2155 stop:2880 length:726 start_codon:yes stop_codon:yes gene_type:complete